MNKELKKLRIDYDFTQKNMGEKVFGISESSYCKKEKGTTKFTVDEIKKAKKFFNLTDNEVVKIFLI